MLDHAIRTLLAAAFLALVCPSVSPQTPRVERFPPNPCSSDSTIVDSTPACGTAPTDIPEVWFDIPSCPLVAELRPGYGGLYPVLVNRSDRAMWEVSFAYVEQLAGNVHVVDKAGSMSIYDVSIGPGEWWDGVFPNDECPCTSWTLRTPKEYAALRIAVRGVTFVDGSRWNAAGQRWNHDPVAPVDAPAPRPN